MFDPSSRYASIDTAYLDTAEGRRIAYKKRRFIPAASRLHLLVEVTVSASDRLDLIAGRTLGDPEQFWRICDASNAVNPRDLVEPGRTLRVPIPEPEGLT